jgi:glycosyltransferase involved in cell wall biosynthesis
VPSIAALVVSLPERAHLLTEALASVHAQTRQPDDIVVGIDPRLLGEVGNMNRLIDATDSEWLAFLHDDDLWHPEHLEVCESLFDTADVVVSRFELVGRPVSTIEPWHENFEDLRFTNWIGSPSMVVARRSVFRRWCDPFGPFRWIDWANYNRLLESGARFADTGLVTTSYRFFGGNGSWKGDV